MCVCVCCCLPERPTGTRSDVGSNPTHVRAHTHTILPARSVPSRQRESERWPRPPCLGQGSWSQDRPSRRPPLPAPPSAAKQLSKGRLGVSARIGRRGFQTTYHTTHPGKGCLDAVQASELTGRHLGVFIKVFQNPASGEPRQRLARRRGNSTTRRPRSSPLLSNQARNNQSRQGGRTIGEAIRDPTKGRLLGKRWPNGGTSFKKEWGSWQPCVWVCVCV